MKRRTLIKAAAVLIGVPSLLVICLLLYLLLADLSGWRDRVASLASDAIGRELKINGEFKPEIGLTTRVVAGDITLASPAWSTDPHMVSVNHLAGEVDLLSFLFGPITIRDVEITGAKVLFELSDQGESNWALGSGEASDGGGGEVELIISHALFKKVALVYDAPARAAPLEASLDHLEFTDDGTGMLDLDLGGSISESQVEIAGRLGTFVGLINAAAVKHDLTGRFADTDFSTKGTIDSLSSLSGIAGSASASGSDCSQITDAFGLEPIVDGPFTVEASVKPSGAGSDVDLDVSAGGMKAHLAGVVDSLAGPGKIDVTVTASGPDIRSLGKLTGITELPEEEFSVSGGIRWEGFPIHFKEVDINVGKNTLSADGVLGAPPQMLGTDFTIQGGGPNVSAIGALIGIGLPHDSFAVSGRVVRVEGGLQVEAMKANIGRTTLEAEGKVGDPPHYAGTTLNLHAEVPKLAYFNDLFGFDLPAESFSVDGRLIEGDQAITLDGVRARLGRSTLRVDGNLKTENKLVGTSLKIEADGPDAAQIAGLFGLTQLAAEPWSIDGRLNVLEAGYGLDGVSAAVGRFEALADGRLSATGGLVGTDLQLHAEDLDLAHAMSIFGVDGFPQVPVRAAGRLRVEDSGIRLDGTTATAGDIGVAVDGLIAGGEDLDGTNGHVEVRGPLLESVGPYFHFSGLPKAPFSVVGGVRVTGGRVDLEKVVTVIDSNRISIDGTIGTVRGLVGTDVTVDVSGPDLGRAGRLAEDLTKLPELPAEPFTLTTGFSIDDEGYSIDGLHASLDKAMAAVDGRVGSAAKMVGTDLDITVNGPNASLFSALTGVTVPASPFKVSGRIRRTNAAVLFDHFSVELGGHAMALHGSLGERPRLVGTELNLSASGPGTALIQELTGFQRLPDEPFSLTGHFEGTHEKFTAEGLDLVLGPSDLKGSLEVDIRGKPHITAKVSSNHLELGSLAPRPSGQDDQAPAPQTAPGNSKTGLVFSEEPIDFGWLRRTNADVDITIVTLQLPVERFHDFELEAHLVDGRLHINRVAMVGSREGSGSGSLVLEPVGDGYRGELNLDLSALRFDPPGAHVPDATSAPPIDFNVRLKAHGMSPHEFAGSTDGSIQIIAGRGVMNNRVLDMITADILLTLLNAFNPFAKDDVTAELQCAVALVTFDDGIATLAPMAVQSDKMTMLGGGKLDLTTEKLNFDWITKPRKGIGLSTSMLTNPYIKVGGTLGNPAIELKGMEAVASTGVAVATMGLSLVAKGMLDRVTAEKKVCKKALEEVEKIRAKN